jgi:hypothetical protein
MESEWVRLGEKVSRHKFPVHLLKIEQKRIQGGVITSYPTIQYVHGKDIDIFSGERTMDVFFDYIKGHVLCTTCKKVLSK